MQNNAFIDFVSEIFQRLTSKTPKFFVIWQWISATVAAVTGLPGFLQDIGVTLPKALAIGENKIVAIASLVALVMAKLPVQQTVVNKDATGAPLTKTDPAKTPFTAKDQIKKMIGMKYVFLLLLCAISFNVSAQSPFRPLTKLNAPGKKYLHALTTPDSTLNTWRFIADIAAYAEPGNILMAGVGYGYQHLKYNFAAAKWNAQWSINAVGFAGGSVAPTTPASIVSFGVMAGIDNNLFMAGPIYNPGTKQFGIALSIGISLNN